MKKSLLYGSLVGIAFITYQAHAGDRIQKRTRTRRPANESTSINSQIYTEPDTPTPNGRNGNTSLNGSPSQAVISNGNNTTSQSSDSQPTLTPSQKKRNLFFDDIRSKFFFYKPNYFVFGAHDLKIQFSAMYNFGESFNLNLGYTQTMLWRVYDSSQPLRDVHYQPDIFYRFKKSPQSEVTSYDLGVAHNSNGFSGRESRSVDRLYFKTNYHFKNGGHSLIGYLNLYHVIGYDLTNRDIRKFWGYWDLYARYTHLIRFTKAHMDAEFRVFAGSKVVNFGRGGRMVGLIHHFNSRSFHPSLYLQYYGGYSETLIDYNRPNEELRFGFMLAL